MRIRMTVAEGISRFFCAPAVATTNGNKSSQPIIGSTEGLIKILIFEILNQETQ
jgi:hypothetical protein